VRSWDALLFLCPTLSYHSPYLFYQAFIAWDGLLSIGNMKQFSCTFVDDLLSSFQSHVGVRFRRARKVDLLKWNPRQAVRILAQLLAQHLVGKVCKK